MSHCAEKKRYKSPREAERAARYCRQLRDIRLRFYRCPDCKDWHLTSVTDGFDLRAARRMRAMEKNNPC